MPRATRLTAGLLCALLAGGCESLRGLGRNRDSEAAPTGAVQPQTADKLVAYLNAQAEAVNALQYPRISSVSGKMGRETFTLTSGSVACEKPNNFAISGGRGVLGEVMFAGSNEREFWIYTRLPERAYYYCPRAELPAVASKLPIPLDPDWALQALGMTAYPPDRTYEVQTLYSEREHHLSYPHTTPGGKPVRVTVVFAADAKDGPDPQVKRLVVEDPATKQVVATAVIKAVARDAGGPTGGVPERLVLAWPQEQAELDLDLGRPTVNPAFDAGQRAAYFSRRPVAGVEPIDLTRVNFRGAARAQAPAETRAHKPGARHAADWGRWAR